jgi:hypothetical protein
MSYQIKNCPENKIALTTLKTIFSMRGSLPLFTTALFLSSSCFSFCSSFRLIGTLRMDFTDDMGEIILEVEMGGQ